MGEAAATRRSWSAAVGISVGVHAALLAWAAADARPRPGAARAPVLLSLLVAEPTPVETRRSEPRPEPPEPRSAEPTPPNLARRPAALASIAVRRAETQAETAAQASSTGAESTAPAVRVPIPAAVAELLRPEPPSAPLDADEEAARRVDEALLRAMRGEDPPPVEPPPSNPFAALDRLLADLIDEVVPEWVGPSREIPNAGATLPEPFPDAPSRLVPEVIPWLVHGRFGSAGPPPLQPEAEPPDAGPSYAAHDRRRALHRQLSAAWRSAAPASRRRAELFALWNDTADDELGAEGRRLIERWIRRRLPPGSADAFGADDLRRLSARSRHGPFAPYGPRSAGGSPPR